MSSRSNSSACPCPLTRPCCEKCLSVHGGSSGPYLGEGWGVWQGDLQAHMWGISRPTPGAPGPHTGGSPGPGGIQACNETDTPQQMATAVGGTHPTEIHSCVWISFSKDFDSLPFAVQMTLLFWKVICILQILNELIVLMAEPLTSLLFIFCWCLSWVLKPFFTFFVHNEFLRFNCYICWPFGSQYRGLIPFYYFFQAEVGGLRWVSKTAL